ncbi:NUDIX domain-containing protein [Bittarella massiliensis (ex Durand et al. 2017)]|uniref:NUDIX domain-containing protein n=1 Tax=Bittarella massiliensis (ex Durand et al. 2017) TaxID=1720313 RepID=UPI001AA10AA1|nr:NUDIX hydrolase [Bittarella massiliensis (ex Durand et al. 2017)]MBO1679083.1 NUDIX hydrolase [Bittarella massiliensis (ex Durand et al. 2017)]
MKLNETTVTQNTVFSGRIITVCDDEVELENGKRTRREVVYHHGGVCVVPFDGENTYLVRQFRYPYKEVVRESPAGKLEPGEDPLACGKRELEEELGAVAGRYTDLGCFYPSPGYTSEVIHLYLAEELSFTRQNLDEDEFLEIEKLPLRRAVQQVLTGELVDGKTQAALLKAAALRGLLGEGGR